MAGEAIKIKKGGEELRSEEGSGEMWVFTCLWVESGVQVGEV